MSAGKSVVCVCTLLVGLIVISVAVLISDYDNQYSFQRWFLKRSSDEKKNDLFEGDHHICDATTSSSSSSSDEVQKSSLKDSSTDDMIINDRDVVKPQGFIVNSFHWEQCLADLTVNFNKEEEGFLKRSTEKKNDLFEGNNHIWDVEKATANSNATTTTTTTTTTTSTTDDIVEKATTSSSLSSSLYEVQNSSLKDSTDDMIINVREVKPKVEHHYHHAPGVVGPSIRDEMIRLTTKVVHFFIAKNAQYKYQPPMHPGPSTMSLTFWLAFAPSITLSRIGLPAPVSRRIN